MDTQTLELSHLDEPRADTTPKIDYTLDYSFQYDKHTTAAHACAQKTRELATLEIQHLPEDGTKVVIAEIHGFPGVEKIYGHKTSSTSRMLLVRSQIDRIKDTIEEELQSLAQENGLICNTSAEIPGASLVLTIELEHDLDSTGIDSKMPGILTSYEKSFLRISLQKIPVENIPLIPSETLIEKISKRIREFF